MGQYKVEATLEVSDAMKKCFFPSRKSKRVRIDRIHLFGPFASGTGVRVVGIGPMRNKWFDITWFTKGGIKK